MSRTSKTILISSVSVIIVILVMLFYLPGEEPAPAEPIVDEIIEPEIIKMKFGLPERDYHFVEGKISKGEHLAKILYAINLPNQTVHAALTSMDSVFSVRKIRYYNHYHILYSKDSLSTPAYFVYEIDKENYVICSLREPFTASKAQREVEFVTKQNSVSIKNSLWMSLVDQGSDPLLALELSEIYAWTIDFFGLQENDSISFIYEAKYIDSVYAGIHKIVAAKFIHNNQELYALPFHQDGKDQFFDLEGNSLQRQFLKAPLRFSRISSKFSHSRLHPILKIRRPHHGVDYAAPIGTPVLAIGDGKVIKAQVSGGAGKMVKIQHNSVYTSAYLHLSRYGENVKVGNYIKQGDIIGYVGSSGLSTGPHLDFRVYKNTTPIDPLKMESPAVSPISEENKMAFDSVKVEFVRKLGNSEYNI